MFWSTPPAKVTTDTIIPLHFFDDTPLWRAFILYSMFIFDAILDPQKLRESLEALIQKEGWRKIGARLRKNTNGELEYHIPDEFNRDRPALSYSHVTHDMNAIEHHIAARLPNPSSRPAIVCDPDEFQSLFHREGGPVKLYDYLNNDIPQLGLHIVSFKDKTIICLDWPHTLMDAMGKRALLNAWTLMLQNRSNEIPTPQGYSTDPLENLGKNPIEPYKLATSHLSTLKLAQYTLRNIPNFFRPLENRMLCIPHPFLFNLHKEALQQVSPTFLSEADILSAWWTRIQLSITNLPPKTTVVLNNAYSLRAPLSKDLLPPTKGPYISNAIAFLPTLLSAQEITSQPLSTLASTIRHTLQNLGTREQVEAFTSLWRKSPGKLPPFFGDGRMYMLTFSNWCKAGLFEVDFSSAILRSSDLSRAEGGRPSYIQNNQFGLRLPNGFPIIGKDREGNFWLSGCMSKGQWGKVEEELARGC